MPIERNIDALTALLNIAATAAGCKVDAIEQDVDIDLTGLTTHGKKRFRPFNVKERSSVGVGTYSGDTRGVISVASVVFALASRQELGLSKMKVLASLVGMMVIEKLRAAGVDIGPLRHGMCKVVNEVVAEALAEAGVAPIKRKSGKNLVLYTFVPTDPTEQRWTDALLLWNEMAAEYHGWLGSDSKGKERTVKEVCDAIVKFEEEAIASAKKAKEAREVKDAEAEADAIENAANAAARPEQCAPFSGTQWEAICNTASTEGVDTDDPEAMRNFLWGCYVLAFAATEEEQTAAEEAA